MIQLSEFSCADLSVVQYVIDEEAQDLFTAHLDGYALAITREEMSQLLNDVLLRSWNLLDKVFQLIVYNLHFLHLNVD